VPSDFCWEIKDADLIKKEDIWFMIMVGGNYHDGLVAKGEFSTDPFTLLDETSGQKRVCAMARCDWRLSAELGEVIEIKRLQEMMPDFDWTSETSGVLLDKKYIPKIHFIRNEVERKLMYNLHYESPEPLKRAIEIALSTDYNNALNSLSDDLIRGFRTMRDAKTEEEAVVCVLHSTYFADDFDALKFFGFSKEVIKALCILAKRDEVAYYNRYSYEDYINDLIESKNRTAINVQYLILKDYLDPARNKAVSTDEDFVRSYKRLEEVVGTLNGDNA